MWVSMCQKEVYGIHTSTNAVVNVLLTLLTATALSLNSFMNVSTYYRHQAMGLAASEIYNIPSRLQGLTVDRP